MIAAVLVLALGPLALALIGVVLALAATWRIPSGDVASGVWEACVDDGWATALDHDLDSPPTLALAATLRAERLALDLRLGLAPKPRPAGAQRPRRAPRPLEMTRLAGLSACP